MNLILSVNAHRLMMHVKFEMTFENGNSAFYTFSVFPLFFERCASQKSCPLYNLKTS